MGQAFALNDPRSSDIFAFEPLPDAVVPARMNVAFRWLGLMEAAVVAGSLAAAEVGKDSLLPPASTSDVEFARDIAPILERNCYQCHGPEKQKNGLRLDTRAAALQGGDSGPAIVPGRSADSLVIRYVAGADEERIMPPKGERLSAGEIGLLRAWIDRGAIWDGHPALRSSGATTNRHWSFQAIQQSPPPAVQDSGWVRNEIDSFILDRLESENVPPSAEANRTTLARRLSLDLTGLPPNPDEVDAFVSDERPDAYERLVDRFLASPRFGEQWARHWLDLARYADTDGYEKDFYRPHAWRWRDWVIASINRDQPFDEFTRDQIAGDLLDAASVEQRVATGFHRNTLLNREGGVDIEEDRCKIVADRINTIGTTWLGLTVGCAECHSHKYDPISQREYYQLYAFFNSTDDRDIPAPRASELDALGPALSELEREKRRYVEGRDAVMEGWETRVAALPEIWLTPRREDYDLPTFGANNGANLYHQEDGSFLVTGMVENKCHYIMMLNTKLKGITGIRVEPMTDEMLPLLGPGWATNGNFVLTELYVESAPLTNVNHLKTNALTRVVADYSQPGFPIANAIDGDLEKGGWAVDNPALALHGMDRCAVFILKEDLGLAGGDFRLKVSLVQNEGRSHTLGRVRVSYTTAPREQLADQAVPQRIREIARLPRERRTLDQQVTLKRYFQATFLTNSAELAAISRVLATAPDVRGSVQAQTLVQRTVRRPTHVHIRGDFLNQGPEVQPGTPAVLHPSKSRGPSADRIDLANWLTDPANPLTARVAVNQVWAGLFGEGLVGTPADFGAQGDLPTNPGLLDWLAGEFMRTGWSRKQLIKRIVMSATYRQSSDQRADLLQRDARNRLFARQNRFRLSAENARDQLLGASGGLDSTLGGPSVAATSNRRGLYLQYKRSFPEYMLATFDAPSTTASCARRERSDTPLQALSLLNDPVFVRCAQDLAARSMACGGSEVSEQLRRAFRWSVGRPPTDEEARDLEQLHRQVREICRQKPAPEPSAAGAASDRSNPDTTALTVVARAILNLDEVITRE